MSEINLNDGVDVLLEGINKHITNKCRYEQQKTQDGETLLVISMQEKNTTKIGELQYVILEFLSVYQNPTKFIVEVDINERSRKVLADYFCDYVISRNISGHLLFRKKRRSKY